MFRHLIVTDFDGTIAATFETSHGGVDVNVASKRAIKTMFGQSGLKAYEDLGGLRNREPGELIAELKKIIKLDAPEIEMTEAYVNAKLSHLIPEIGRSWPRLLPGVKEFLNKIQSGELPVDLAIVSSGHDEFITEVFVANGLRTPENLVTSETIRLRSMPPPRPRFKPDTFQLAQAHMNWVSSEVHDGPSYHAVREAHQKPYMLYVGDDGGKDASLALNGRIPFVHIPQGESSFKPDPRKGQIQFADFGTLTAFLEERISGIQGEEESFAQIFFGRSDSELFPPLQEHERPFNKALEEERQRQSARVEGF